MSLQVWLPLNGDLKNQGLANVVTNGIGSDNSWDTTSSKIGKSSLLLTKITNTISVPSLIGKKEMSFAYWVRVNNAWSTNWLDGIRWYSTNGSTNTYSRQEFYTNCTKVGVWFAGSPNSNSGKDFSIGIWHHLAFSISYLNGTSDFYIDGTLVGHTTGVYTDHYIQTGNFQIGDSGVDININDFRIYDHYLSAKEVKEIAKGLILHYKLDDSLYNDINLMPDHLNMPLGSANPETGTWRVAGTSNMTRTRVNITDGPEGPCYGFQNEGIQTANDGSCYGIDSFPFEANTIYTISMWARIVSGTEGYAGFNVYSISSEVGGSHSTIDKNYRVTTLPTNGDWIKCWYTIKTNGSTTRNIYIGITTGQTSVTTQMCCVHIEKLDRTKFVTIYDDSGYGYNGFVFGSLKTTNLSSRYNSATYSENGTSNYIQTPSLYFNNEAITLNIWFKSTNTTPPSDYHMIVDSVTNRQWYEIAIHKNGYFRGGLFVNGTRYADNCSSTIGLNGNWHMLTLTYDGNAVKRYFDGILEKTTTVAKSSGLSSPTVLRLGKDGQSSYACKEASLSDFRIYATALSAEDILELYHTSASIDHDGNVYAREFDNINSSNRFQINHRGQMIPVDKFIERDEKLASIIKNDDVLGGRFYEY